MTDEQLFAEYLDCKTQDAFTELHKRHCSRVTKWIVSQFFFASRGEAQDIVQLAFLHAHEQGAKWDRSREFLRWLFALAFHVATKEGRKRRKVKRGGDISIVPFDAQHDKKHDHTEFGNLDPVSDPVGLSYYEKTDDGDLIEHEATHEEIHSLIGTLEADDQELYDLIYAEDMTEREAANKLGISRHKVRLRLAAMHRRLEGALTI